jgi:hypothetical protein
MRSQNSVKSKQAIYANFAGLDTSKSDILLENPENQAFPDCDNVRVDYRGFISNERPLEQMGGEERKRVTHVKWYSAALEEAIYAVEAGGMVSLKSSTFPNPAGGGSTLEEDKGGADNSWPGGSIISSTMLNGRVFIASGGQNPVTYEGGGEFYNVGFANDPGGTPGLTKGPPSFVTTILGRLAWGGFSTDVNEIQLSRVDDGSYLPDGEDPASVSVNKAFRFNIGNLLGNNEYVTGLASFENNRFAVFTTDRVMIYNADFDYSKWAFDERVAISVGTISHNSIADAGGDLLFCSRYGIHSVRRSNQNGATLYTLPLTQRISEVYKQLVQSVPDPRMISAVYDRDDGRYHVFFPVNDAVSYRLSLAIDPIVREGDPSIGRWTLSTFGGVTCGDYLAGRLVYGSRGGLLYVGEEQGDGDRGAGEVTFPLLWQGDSLGPKVSHQLALYAAGVGKVTFSASDERGRDLGEVVFELPDDDQLNFIGVPLAQQFQRPFAHQYIGLRLRMKIESSKQLRVFAIRVLTKEN